MAETNPYESPANPTYDPETGAWRLGKFLSNTPPQFRVVQNESWFREGLHRMWSTRPHIFTPAAWVLFGVISVASVVGGAAIAWASEDRGGLIFGLFPIQFLIMVAGTHWLIRQLSKWGSMLRYRFSGRSGTTVEYTFLPEGLLCRGPRDSSVLPWEHVESAFRLRNGILVVKSDLGFEWLRDDDLVAGTLDEAHEFLGTYVSKYAGYSTR